VHRWLLQNLLALLTFRPVCIWYSLFMALFINALAANQLGDYHDISLQVLHISFLSTSE
jgi:hypothetical protein